MSDLKAKMHQNRFPDPAAGAYIVPQTSWLDLRRPTCKRRGGEGRKVDCGGEMKGGEGRKKR